MARLKGKSSMAIISQENCVWQRLLAWHPSWGSAGRRMHLQACKAWRPAEERTGSCRHIGRPTAQDKCAERARKTGWRPLPALTCCC